MGANVVTRGFEVKSRKEGEVIDVTGSVREAVAGCELSSGVATIFVVGSTAAVTTIEFEPGLVRDFPEMMDRVAPRDAGYEHEERWHDGNGHPCQGLAGGAEPVHPLRRRGAGPRRMAAGGHGRVRRQAADQEGRRPGSRGVATL